MEGIKEKYLHLLAGVPPSKAVQIERYILDLEKTIEAQYELHQSQAETNKAMGARLLKYETALKRLRSEENLSPNAEIIVGNALKLP